MILESFTVEQLVELVAILSVIFPVVGFVWAPKTWVPGELVTAAAMNTNIRDNLNETLRADLSTLTGIQNDFFVAGPFAYIKFNGASNLTLTGALIDGGNIDGARITFENIGSANVTIKNLDSGSQSANQFTNDVGGDITLAPTERADLYYDTANTTWRTGKTSVGALTRTLGSVNLFPDPFFIMWPYGDTSRPAGAILTVDGNSGIARSTTTYKEAGMAPQLKLGTTATVSTVLEYEIFNPIPASWKGRPVGFGVLAYSDTPGLANFWISDGGTPGHTASAFHPGDSTWRWLSLTHTLASDATKVEVRLRAAISAQGASEVSAFFDGATFTLGPVAPTAVKPPAGTLEGILYFGKIFGNVGTGISVRDFDARKPFIVTDVSLRAGTAPTGAALIVDVNHFDGSVLQSMFGATKPNIADAASPAVGGKAPDGTYQYRCFAGRKDTDSLANAVLGVDVDQVGSTVPGADLQISVAVLQFMDPLKALKL